MEVNAASPNRIDALRAPLLVAWQITRDCDLSCLHCCTESAPGKRLPEELDEQQALGVVREIVANDVPYVMLCGGEPLVVPHFLALAEALGAAGVSMKIETNGQKLQPWVVDRLARLPIRSVQISLDGDSEETYRQQRPGGALAKAHMACRLVREAGLPLEITFAPTRLNIDELLQVMRRACSLGAFRFNTGKLMRIGTAARRWNSLEPTAAQYRKFLDTLGQQAQIEPRMEVCYIPFDVAEGLRRSLDDPPATMLVLPDGRVKVAAALPYVCADLRRESLAEAWDAYRDAWRDQAVLAAARRAAGDESRHAEANRWVMLPAVGI
jgi:MoaA/NifB/PqqE/SkfB family radical SAM enzyme